MLVFITGKANTIVLAIKRGKLLLEAFIWILIEERELKKRERKEEEGNFEFIIGERVLEITS